MKSFIPYKRINILDLDIYSRRISFYYDTKEKIGSFFGFILTLLYILITIILFLNYIIKTVKRTDVVVHDSTMVHQGLPSIGINPNILYFAFGLENSSSLNRYIDETIYKPNISFIYKEKENGQLVTKDKIYLNVERCNVSKFGEKYKNLFVENELDNSYCLNDYSLTLMGGFKYDKFSYMRIEISPCKNTSGKNDCKPQQVIDSYLSSAYFSMMIKDIGLNPLNYSVPIIPILQNLYTTVDKSLMRDFLLYFGITEIQTDKGLFSTDIQIDSYLQLREYKDTFVFMNETNYYKGRSIFNAQIRLDEYVKIQKRTYTKFSEILSVIGGYMQMIYTISSVISLLTKNINVEKKLLNSLFNFNISQKRIILSIQYQKRLNYLLHSDKGVFNAFLPYVAKKSMIPQKKNTTQYNSKYNKLILNKNNSFSPLIHKSATGNLKLKLNIKNYNNYSDKEIYHIKSRQIKQNKSNNLFRNVNEQNLKTKMSMLYKDESDSQNNRIILKKFKYSWRGGKIEKKDTYEMKDINEKVEPYSLIDFNIFDYYCRFGRKRKKNEIDLFKYGVYFYRNQMNIIHFFNVFFLTEIMLNQKNSKKKDILSQIVEIPL
jgi:hypothetical protein